MNISLELIRETDKARLYRFKSGDELWIPKSVVRNTLKHKPEDPLAAEIHELTIEDWWWDKYEQNEEPEHNKDVSKDFYDDDSYDRFNRQK